MSTAANCLYGSTLSPPRLLQVRQAVHAHLASCGGPDQDDLFKFYLPHIRRQMKEVLGFRFFGGARGRISFDGCLCPFALLVSLPMASACRRRRLGVALHASDLDSDGGGGARRGLICASATAGVLGSRFGGARRFQRWLRGGVLLGG